jgi:hypothetical protein
MYLFQKPFFSILNEENGFLHYGNWILRFQNLLLNGKKN